MIFSKAEAAVYLPGRGHIEAIDEAQINTALSQVTHLGIGAHPDDIEFMMWQGILSCYRHPVQHFASVVLTNGQGSSRIGPYAAYSDAQMAEVRWEEQRRVAEAGGYAATLSLGYTSQELRQTAKEQVCADIKAIVRCCRPQVIYTHNLADRHDSHVAAFWRVLRALRELGPEFYPREFYGCEVWRSLDWLTGADRRINDVDDHANVMRALMGLYDSQISGGKSYDLANFGRRQGNATYNDAYQADVSALAELTMDLRPLLDNPTLTPAQYFSELQEHFGADVRERLRSMA